VSVQDEASNSTPNPCHDRSSADSRVVLGSPERSPAPRNREKQSDNLATGLCHDFDLHVPVGHFEQFLDGLHEYRHNLEQRAQHLEQRERNFRAEIHQHKATIEKLKEDLKKRESIATGMEKFLSLLAGLEAENVNLKAQLDGLKDENAKLEGQNNEVGAQNDELNTEKDDLKGQLDQLEKKQIDFKQKFSSEKARLKAENMKLNTKQLVLEKQVYTFQRLYDKSRRFLPSCHTCDENFKRVTEFFEATLQNLPAQDWDSYTPMNETLSHIQTHHPPDEIFKLSKTAPAQNAGADLTPRSTVTTARQEKNDIFKQFGPHPTDSNDPKFPPKFPSIQAQSSKRKPTEEPQHQDPKRQRNDSKVSQRPQNSRVLNVLLT
jgi:myosin heavy subunit